MNHYEVDLSIHFTRCSKSPFKKDSLNLLHCDRVENTFFFPAFVGRSSLVQESFYLFTIFTSSEPSICLFCENLREDEQDPSEKP